MGMGMLFVVKHKGVNCIAQRMKAIFTDQFDQYDAIRHFLSRDSEAILKLLPRCQFVNWDEQDSEDWETNELLQKLTDCPEGEKIALLDCGEYTESVECKFVFIVNYDTNTLQSYMRGMDFMFSEYPLDNLPDTYDYERAYYAFGKEHVQELRENVIAREERFYRELALSHGDSPEEAEAYVNEKCEMFRDSVARGYFDIVDEDEDEDDDEDSDEEVYEIECKCGNIITLYEEDLDDGSVICDECGAKIKFSTKKTIQIDEEDD